ncbi:MAG: hypothetical protein K6T92_07460 [Candidatus Rokubacteria bacterium]|nr:hypothetical protein [Candidatus Rokubacteria bacterium]
MLVIDAGRPRPAERSGPRQAQRAVLDRAAVERHGRAAAVADRIIQKGDAAPGLGGEPAAERRPAVEGARRQDQIQQTLVNLR